MGSSDQPNRHRYPLLLLLALLAMTAWSVHRPKDYFTWFLETFPVWVALAILLISYRRFPLTPLAYTLIFLHACILLVGGHYTYAQVPLFTWLEGVLGQSRNNFDRVGHFAQGFVPAILAREVLLRRSPLVRGKWLFTLVVCVCMTVSALYEISEWVIAALSGPAANDFLGTQGDIYDTQKDMTMCLIGAVLALVLLSGIHDRQLAILDTTRVA
jgi:putative membrane protein